MPTIRTTMAPNCVLHGCPAGSTVLPSLDFPMERASFVASHLTPVEVIALRYSEDSPTPGLGSPLVADGEPDPSRRWIQHVGQDEPRAQLVEHDLADLAPDPR